MAFKDMEKHLQSPVIEVTVKKDADQIVYYLHQSLLCEVSGYFRGCLQGSFAEASSRKVLLAGIKLKVFGLFVKWLYTGELIQFDGEEKRPPEAEAENKDTNLVSGSGEDEYSDEHEDGDEIIETLVDVYILGDRLLSPDLKNRCTDMVQEWCGIEIMPLRPVQGALQARLGECHLIDFLMKMLAWELVMDGSMEFLMEDDDLLKLLVTDGGFTSKLMAEALRLTGLDFTNEEPQSPDRVEGCFWHEHADNKDLGCKRWAQSR